MAMSAVPYWDLSVLTQVLGFRGAVDAIERALRDGYDPATDIARLAVPVRSGELLLMASDVREWTGIKIVAVAPGNARHGLPRIQGVFTLFNAETLAPAALIDGAALTLLRTPAVSIAGTLPLLTRLKRPLDVVLFGRGPQGVAHVEALREVTAATGGIGRLTVVARTPGRPPAGVGDQASVVSVEGADEALAGADVVLCTTTARTPLFDGELLKDGCVVVAMGSHEPDARELDPALVARSHVVVEDIATALREAGDLVMAIDEGQAGLPSRLITMAQLITGAVLPPADRPTIFKTTGMGWQDLVVAAAVAERVGA